MTENADFLSHELLAAEMQRVGYRAEIIPEGVKSATQGLTFLITVFPNQTMQARVSINMPEGFTSDDANTFNATYRFGKLFIIERAIVMDCDFLLSELAPVTSQIERLIQIWELSIGAMKDNLRNFIAR